LHFEQRFFMDDVTFIAITPCIIGSIQPKFLLYLHSIGASSRIIE
jgi:hypothetical protein